MLGINRRSQSGIYKNVKKLGWLLTSIAFIIILVGLGLLIYYVLSLKSNEAKNYINQITTLLNNKSGTQTEVLVNLEKGALALKALNNDYIHKISVYMSVLCAGVICFICIRMVVNVILIFRAFDDKMTIIESKFLFTSRMCHYVAIIFCQIAVLIIFSITFVQYASSVIQELEKYLNSTLQWAASSSKTLNSDDQVKTVFDNYNKIKAYYFNKNTNLGTMLPLYNALIARGDKITMSEIKHILDPILWDNVFNKLIIMAAFVMLWLLINISNAIFSVSIISKFDKDNDPLQPKKVMFDKERRKRIAYV